MKWYCIGEHNINNDGINMKKTSWLENKDSKRQNWPLSRAAQINFSYKEPEKHKSINVMWLKFLIFFYIMLPHLVVKQVSRWVSRFLVFVE